MVDQDRDNLDGALSVYDEITGGSDSLVLGSSEINSRAYCSWFGFKVLNLFVSRGVKLSQAIPLGWRPAEESSCLIWWRKE